MKALSTLKSAIHQSSFAGIIALVSLVPVFLPNIALAAELQTQESQKVLVFQIKDPVLNSNQTTVDQPQLAYAELVKSDPLYANLKSYLESYNSPLADYTDKLLTKNNWKNILAISFVESNMCQHHYYSNCSGIGGQEYLRKYHNFGEWIDDMSNLLATRYNGWSFAKMDGVYVQPYSVNWRHGAEDIYEELTVLEQKADQEKLAELQKQQAESQITASVKTFPELAELTVK